MYSVVTSFSPAGWRLYAKNFVDSFYHHFPADVYLRCYWEGSRPLYEGLLPGGNLLDIEPCKSFLARHKYDQVVHGKREGTYSPWQGKARREGYSLRHDAYKFARKVFAVADAARAIERGRMFWIDADVIVQKNVSLELLKGILPSNVSLSYLARPNYHSELGFVGYNLDMLETHAFISAYENEYASDKFLDRGYWDDCNVFDGLVAELKPPRALINNTSNAQPFDNSVLGQFMKHLKGKRKERGQ